MDSEEKRYVFDGITTFDLMQRRRDLEAEANAISDEILARFHKEIGVVRLAPTAPELLPPASRPVPRERISGTPKRSRLADLLRSMHGQ